jgi:hypothetical protein
MDTRARPIRLADLRRPLAGGPPAPRRRGLLAARIVLLGGPTALAFFSGGYFDEARAWAGLGVWLLVAVAVAARAGPFPRSRASWVTLTGLSLLAAWTLASIAWAPEAGAAYHAGQLVVLYLGTLLAAILLLRPPATWLWVEPALALGAVVVIGYGVSERMLPGVLSFARSVSAQGRLEQPLTYWNAMGELAALGLVLCARLVGAVERPTWISRAAAAACAPLGLGLYLSFSRGAIFACVAGLVALLVAAPTRAQLRAVAVSLTAGVVAAAVAGPFRGVSDLAGALGVRERQGAIVLAVLVILMAGAAILQPVLVGSEAGDRLRLPRRAPWLALALICAGLAVAILVGAKESTKAPLSAGASRLTTFQSNRYAYWDVALRAFTSQPLHGVGAGGWAVWWLRYRTVNEFAQDAHSLPLQTAAELGLVGLVFLGMLCGGLAVAARRAHRAAPAVAAGPIAALAVYAAHAPLDWDWQMPAVTLVAVVLAGMVVGVSEGRSQG